MSEEHYPQCLIKPKWDMLNVNIISFGIFVSLIYWFVQLLTIKELLYLLPNVEIDSWQKYFFKFIGSLEQPMNKFNCLVMNKNLILSSKCYLWNVHVFLHVKKYFNLYYKSGIKIVVSVSF